MLDEKLPGVYVSPSLYERVRDETRDDQVLRAARQVAMWRDLGAAGVDLGNVEDLDLACRIVDQAIEIGPAWRDALEDLSFPPPGDDAFYLYAASGEPTPCASRPFPTAGGSFAGCTTGSSSGTPADTERSNLSSRAPTG